ncbi:Mannosyl-oligosaccharide alpha-1,2-mannosidase [Lasiodiplodia theobromae]|uniref:alpha-1,2-Mannosidase n=1 Tax=Lasiodiplodia theobromae TaxID=45133 RepID=A0A5N5DM82_9PEZI|nr:Mannosyl-oligosaccharide alpha-1,2-mannosidase [Lasiodiplodia theobromae]
MHFHSLLHLATVQLALLDVVAASPAGVSRGWLSARQDDVVPTPEENERAAQIKDVFTTAWEGYYTFAFPNDELRPIRHLAGLLSAHDLLTGPLAHLVKNKTQADALLPQARTLADTIKFGFDTPTGIPANNLYINNRTTDDRTDNNIAQVGTLVLEWTRLSDLTNNSEYGELAQRGESWLVNPRGPFGEPFPGLIGLEINITTGRFTTEEGGWIGGVDSFYEYLIKMFVYDPTRFEFYKDRWVTAADSSIKYLESHPNTRSDLTFLAWHNGTRVEGYSEHLACFDGGNFILGGLVLQEQRYVDFGLKLVDGCEAIYNQTLTGLGPDIFRWDPVGSNQSTVPANQTAFYQRAGFYIDAGSYGIGPEALESFYYAYRATGDRKYQDYIWNAFQNLRQFAAVDDVGFSILRDVNAPAGGGFGNYQPSFFLAETLKYAYLAHAPQAAVHVSGGQTADAQDWVFNTEAHPMKVVR